MHRLSRSDCSCPSMLIWKHHAAFASGIQLRLQASLNFSKKLKTATGSLPEKTWSRIWTSIFFLKRGTCLDRSRYSPLLLTGLIRGSQLREQTARSTDVLPEACSGALSGEVRHRPNRNYYDHAIGPNVSLVRHMSPQRNCPGQDSYLVGIPVGGLFFAAMASTLLPIGLIFGVFIGVASI